MVIRLLVDHDRSSHVTNEYDRQICWMRTTFERNRWLVDIELNIEVCVEDDITF